MTRIQTRRSVANDNRDKTDTEALPLISLGTHSKCEDTKHISNTLSHTTVCWKYFLTTYAHCSQTKRRERKNERERESERVGESE